MRILHIFDDYGTPGEKALPGIGSVPSVVYYLAKYAAEMGHDVTVLERGHDPRDPEEEYIGRVRYVRIRMKKLPAAPYRLIKTPKGLMTLISDSLKMAKGIREFLRKENFDVIHVHFPFAATILISVDRDIREKIVYTAHMDEYRIGESKFLKPPIVARMFSPDIYIIKRVKKCVVLNESIRNALVRRGVKREKVEVIPNGIDVNEFKVRREDVERVREKYGVDRITVMFAGTITPRKGVHVLIRAAEIVLKDWDVKFLLVGNTNLDPDYAKMLMDYIRRKNLNVTFTGYIPYSDLKALYFASDVFVLPSFEEGHGVVLTEAMASGRPLIGTHVGGIPMQIRDGWNGFLIKPGDHKMLAERLARLIEDDSKRKEMGKNSKKLAENCFDWSKIAKCYLRVYKYVINSNNIQIQINKKL